MGTPFDQLRSEARARVHTSIRGTYRLTRLLGVGGMAAVYEAQDAQGKYWAVKVVHDRFGDEGQVLQRFKREASVVNRLAHPGVVAIHEVDTDERGSRYLVMDLLKGQSFEFVRRAVGGALAEAHVKWAGTELLRVLAVAHERGVVHRDIKPSNLFLTNDGRLMVLDFGVARAQSSSTAALSLQTVEGCVLGTPTFMAPEQARGRLQEVDARSDIWSVGATLFTLATGRPVHESESANEALGMAMTEPARSVLQLKPELHPELAGVIDRALCFNASERWQSALEMLSALTGNRVNATWKQTARPDLVNLMQSVSSHRYRSGCPAAQESPTPTTVAQVPRSLSAQQRSRSELPTEIRAEFVLLDTRYWRVHEEPPKKVVFLRRTSQPIESTDTLRIENHELLSKLGPKYHDYGAVVDMRQAPSRNDADFERAMRYLRRELSTRFARISVLVSSAAGKLQVARIDRGDGTKTHVTRDEADAIRHARNG